MWYLPPEWEPGGKPELDWAAVAWLATLGVLASILALVG